MIYKFIFFGVVFAVQILYTIRWGKFIYAQMNVLSVRSSLFFTLSLSLLFGG